MPSFGNATIGETPSVYAGGNAVQIAIAVNAMTPGQQAGMLNAHIGQNYNVSEPDPVRAARLAADNTPGLSGTGSLIYWLTPPGAWAG